MSSFDNLVAKKNKGRQKVRMVRMEKDSNRQVTFSKRRCGLFKKASELCTLCGAEAAIIVFSPGKKAFSFGHPSVEAVLNRFMGTVSAPNLVGNEPTQGGVHRDINVEDLNMELTLMSSRIEAEKKRGEELSQMRKVRAQQYRWDVPVDELNFQQLQHMKNSLEELKKHVYQHGTKLMIEATNNGNNINPFMGMINPMAGYNHNNPAIFNPTPGFGYQQDFNY